MSGCSTVSGLWADSSSEQVAGQSLVVTPVGGISVLWRNNVDQRKPASPPGFSLPAVITGSQGELIVAGGQDRRVRIYHPGGSEMDRLTLENPLESGSLQLSNGLVVIGDVGGILYGLDIVTLRVVWKRQLSAALIGVPVAIGEDFIVQTSNNQIYRLTADGKKVWSYSSAQLGGLGIHLNPSPVVYKDRVFAIFANGDLVALKADNGNFLWNRQLLLSNNAAVMSEVKIPTASPLIIPASQSSRNEDVIVVSIFQGELTLLSLQDGSTLATRAISLKSKPLLVDHTVFVADSNGAVSALDSTGTETLWKKQLSDGELTGPVLWQGSIWVADEDARVFRLDQNGKLLASTELDGRIDRMPVAAGAGVLVRNNLGTLYMLH
ncbi:MAG: PQQ-binding-like beta-propeller repeat protein [Mariprofundus sp.]